MVGLAVSPAVQRALTVLPFAHFPSWWVGPIVRSLTTVGVPLLVLGVIAVAGGVSAIGRKRFALSLAGAICALPSAIFGLSFTVDGMPLGSPIRAIPALSLPSSGLLLLPGRIFCTLPSVVLGILAVTFVVLGKREFGVKNEKMASHGASRRGLLTAGGILSIVAATFEMVGGGALVASALSPAVRYALFDHPVGAMGPPVCPGQKALWIAAGVPLLVLAVIAVVGGVSAIRRKSFGWSLAGAICAVPSAILGLPFITFRFYCLIAQPHLATAIFCILPTVLLGILAAIFVVMGKREFAVKAGALSDVSDLPGGQGNSEDVTVVF
jgi:hypothetical protein